MRATIDEPEPDKMKSLRFKTISICPKCEKGHVESIILSEPVEGVVRRRLYVGCSNENCDYKPPEFLYPVELAPLNTDSSNKKD